MKGRALFHPIRVALTGEAGGPELDLAVPAIDRGAALPPSARRGADRRLPRARARRSRRRSLTRVQAAMIIYGSNPVLEALRAAACGALRVGPRGDRRIEEALALARAAGRAGRARRTRRRSTAPRAAECTRASSPRSTRRATTASTELVAAAAPAAPLLVVLDGIEDPHNVGAILRTVDAAGAHGVVRQARHAAPLDGVVAKASAGAVATSRIATVVNIARAVEELKEAGVWTVGLAGDAAERYDEVDLTLPTAIVLGAEGSGLRRLVRERCDRLVSIPDGGAVGSLNVSVAAGVMLFEAARQRRSRKVAYNRAVPLAD